MIPAVPKDWWRSFYDELFAQVALERRSHAALEQEVELVARALDLEPGARVFDQCCGNGNLSVALAARGYDVVAVDANPGYIAATQARARAAGAPVRAEVADARDFVATPGCAAALSWFTSLGHGAEPADDERQLGAAASSLSTGGKLAVDVGNGARIRARFEPLLVSERSTERGLVAVRRTSELHAGGSVLRQTWTFSLERETVTRHSTMRIYSPAELEALGRRVGLVPLRAYGDYDGSSLGPDSPRCVLVFGRGGSR